MKYLKMLGLAVIAAMAMAAFTAGTASATTLMVNGVRQNNSVTINASLATGSSALLQTTSGGFANTCTESTVSGSTSTFTGSNVSGPISSLTFSKCTNEKVVVDLAGALAIAQIGLTLNGTVRSAGAEVTVPSPVGTLNCKTGAGTDIGTFTGKASGHAVMDINAVLNCGFLVPSATWSATYTVTSPTDLAVMP